LDNLSDQEAQTIASLGYKEDAVVDKVLKVKSADEISGEIGGIIGRMNKDMEDFLKGAFVKEKTEWEEQQAEQAKKRAKMLKDFEGEHPNLSRAADVVETALIGKESHPLEDAQKQAEKELESAKDDAAGDFYEREEKADKELEIEDKRESFHDMLDRWKEERKKDDEEEAKGGA